MEFIDDFCAITHATNLTFYRTRLAISTFLETNRWFTGKIIILSLESDPLSNDNIKLVKLLYDDIEEVQVKEQDIKPIASKISKKGWSRESLLDFLFLYSFKIESRGNLYFSNKLVFHKDISDSLCENGISSPVVANIFPSDTDSKLPIDPDLIYVSEREISTETFREMYRSLLSFNLFDPNCKSDSIVKICKLLGIQINRLSNKYLMRTSFYPDSKYTEFIRYHKGIHAIKLNSEESSNHKRIHTYWNHLKNKHCQVKVSHPSKISKRSEIKEIKVDRYYNNIEESELKKNFGKNLSGLDIALYTIVCNNGFIDGTRVMIHSFIKNNQWFTGKIVILCDSKISEISPDQRLDITKIYENVEFREIDSSVYSKMIDHFKKQATNAQLRFIPSFYTFEIFDSIKNHDFIIYLDSDMLVLGDVSELFSTNYPILVSPDAGEFRIGSKYSMFNGGLLVLKRDSYEMRYREKLINHALSMKSMPLADQSVMNSFFTDQVMMLNSNYNCLKRCFPDNKFNQFKSGIKIVHYVGSKPWDIYKSNFESRYQKIEHLWKKELSSIKDSKSELNIVTSSYSDLNLDEISGEIMTTNWGIDLNLPRIDHYVCSVDEPELILSVKKSKSKVKNWLITENVKQRINISSESSIDLFQHMREIGHLGKIHMLPKKQRGEMDLPTSGVQMIYIASFMPLSKLNIFGINLYTIQDELGNFKSLGSTRKENPYTMNNKPHTLKTDVKFIIDSFKRLLNNKVEINCDSKILADIIKLLKSGSNSADILNKINHLSK